MNGDSTGDIVIHHNRTITLQLTDFLRTLNQQRLERLRALQIHLRLIHSGEITGIKVGKMIEYYTEMSSDSRKAHQHQAGDGLLGSVEQYPGGKSWHSIRLSLGSKTPQIRQESLGRSAGIHPQLLLRTNPG